MLNFIKKAWNAIMNMFKVDGNLSIDTSNVYVNGEKADLSVCSISDAATKGYVDDVIGNTRSLTRDDVEQIAKEVFKNGLCSILSSI